MRLKLTVDVFYLDADDSRTFFKIIEIPVMPEVFDTENRAVELWVRDSEIRYNMQENIYTLTWEHIVDSFINWSPAEHMEWKCSELLAAGWVEVFYEDDEE